MRAKRAVVALLLAVGLCLIPGVGRGEIEERVANRETKAYYIDVVLLRAQVEYMLRNPTTFLNVSLDYDPTGMFADMHFPKGEATKGKILVLVFDSRGVFSGNSGVALLSQFKVTLDTIYTFISHITTNMRTDIVAKFYSKGEIPLGYFYQGEYHLWQE